MAVCPWPFVDWKHLVSWRWQHFCLCFDRASPPLVFVFLRRRLARSYSVLSPPSLRPPLHMVVRRIFAWEPYLTLNTGVEKGGARMTACPIWERIMSPLEIHPRLYLAIFLFLSHLYFFPNLVGSCVRLPPHSFSAAAFAGS